MKTTALTFVLAAAVYGQAPQMAPMANEAARAIQMTQRPMQDVQLEPDANDPAPNAKMAAPPCAGKPDLRVASVSLSTPLTIGENTNQMKFTVANYGPAPAGNFFFIVELCPATGACSNPLNFGSGAFNGTLAGRVGSNPPSTAIVTVNPSFYMAIQPGKYRLRLTLDNTNMVKECIETNNSRITLPLSFVPSCAQPDLFSNGSGPNPYLPAVNKGQTITVSVSVFNQGGPFTGPPVPVKLYLRKMDAPPAPQVPVNWTGMINPIPTAGQQHFIKFPIQIPTTMMSGKYMVVSHLDANNQVMECNEQNNWSHPSGPIFQVN